MHRERALSVCEGDFDDYLGNVAHLCQEGFAVSFGFDQPVGEGGKVVEPGAEMSEQAHDPVFVAPEIQHSGERIEDIVGRLAAAGADIDEGLFQPRRIGRIGDMDGRMNRVAGGIIEKF